MKYIADRGYTDTVLKRHVEKGAVLEDEYKKVNIELTEERKDYLIKDRKLYISVEEIPEGQVGEIEPTDDIPEGATVVDRVDIVEDNNEDKKEEEEVTTESDEEKVEDSQEENAGDGKKESNEEDTKEAEPVVESDEKKEEKEKAKSNSKTNAKNSKKSEEK